MTYERVTDYGQSADIGDRLGLCGLVRGRDRPSDLGACSAAGSRFRPLMSVSRPSPSMTKMLQFAGPPWPARTEAEITVRLLRQK